MVATIGALVLLIAVKLGILPEPLAAKPIADALFVQLNTVPTTAPLKFTAVVADPLQTNWLAGATTVGVGLTVTVAVIVGPVQLPCVGIIVKVTSTGALVVLVSAPLILPDPLAAIPVTATLLSLVQL